MIINDLDKLEDYIYYLKRYCNELESDKTQIKRSFIRLGNEWEDRVYERIKIKLDQLFKIIQDKIEYFEGIIKNLEELAYKLKVYLS